MPLPLVGWAIAAGVSAVAGAVASHKGKKRAYDAGYRQAEAEGQARVNRLMQQLDELQRERERVKDQFRDIVTQVSTLEVEDKGFFSKIAGFVKGYTTFHIYVVGVIAAAKARCLELSLTSEESTEVKSIIFGVLEGGFPDNLKKDVNAIWNSDDRKMVQTRYVQCQKKLPVTLAAEFLNTVKEIDIAVLGMHENRKKESTLQAELQELQSS